MPTESTNLMTTAASIVTAYACRNSLPISELSALIGTVHKALQEAVGGKVTNVEPKLTPAIPVRKSVTDEHIVCLEDGKTFKSLRRHLMTSYGLTPEAYRVKWGLPSDYPMVASNYAAQRSKMAKDRGFGRKKVELPPPTPPPAPKAKRGRPPKIAAA